MNNNSSVSIVIPCRNEGKYIGRCLDSIINSDFPHNRLEVLVVDGMSDDGTRSIIQRYSKKYPFIKFIDNIKRITPVAMNMGIREAVGDYVIILSSHSEVDRNFLRVNLDYIEKNPVDCVGGRIVTLPANESLAASAISIAMSHPFGVGNSYFRIGLSESRLVDTVPFGCYRKDTLMRIGLFDEDLIRNQDDELNLRLLKRGGKILLVPDIVSHYVARDSLSKLWNMYYQYGYFKPLVARKLRGLLTWRQLVPSLLVSALTVAGLLSFASPVFIWIFACIVILYLAGNFSVACSIARKKGLRYFVALPAVFTVLHFSYGTGYLKGIWDFILFNKQQRHKISDVPMSR